MKKELLRFAATSSADKNVICVAHYDFICALLDELVVLERTGSVKGPFKVTPSPPYTTQLIKPHTNTRPPNPTPH